MHSPWTENSAGKAWEGGRSQVEGVNGGDISYTCNSKDKKLTKR